jgi:integrase
MPDLDPWAAPAGETGSTWCELRDAFLAGLTPLTAISYAGALVAFFTAHPGGPAAVRRVDVVRWVEAIRAAGRAEATVKQRLAGLSSFFRFLSQGHGPHAEQARADNPCAGVKTRRVDPYSRARPPLEKPALLRLLAAATPRTRAWILMHILTGRRRSEIARLQWEDLERRGGGWWYRWSAKGDKRGRSEVPADVMDALLAWRGAGTHTGRLWGASSSALAKDLKRTARRAGLDESATHVHGLRHLAAMLWREDGADVAEIQERLGHGSPATTMIYMQHLAPKRDTRSGSIMRRLLET